MYKHMHTFDSLLNSVFQQMNILMHQMGENPQSHKSQTRQIKNVFI